ncbi:hypothetical protein GCM10010251_66930 [Streptomyces aurantiogriseus]|uniref:Uncharacterized protein n=1 Tax=Streptomyces aurantiogriseus TaxID=66870 RepID=A0A918FIT3_9ACTN|nr:hypothetical protein GCM10010251_66930 [Streptomyces aurantiogriseus]
MPGKIVKRTVVKGATGVVRSVERKAQNVWSLLRQGPLWANSPVLSPVRLDAGRVRSVRGRALWDVRR